MNDPESYIKYRRLQYRDNMRCLTENIGRFKWSGTNGYRVLDMGSEHAGQATLVTSDVHLLDVNNIQNKDVGRVKRVLDVGSGDGHFTSHELRQALPPHYQLVGCDMSPAMVYHANTHHAGDGVKFELAEIGKPLPDHFIGAFDHIFSFFCYHWIPNQKLAFSQTYDMLAQGGDCLLLMVAYFPLVFDVYRWLSRSKKWSKWIVNLDDLISPYHDCEMFQKRNTRHTHADKSVIKHITTT